VRVFYWCSCFLTVVASWGLIWVLVTGVIVDPYYDGKIERLAESRAPNGLSKQDLVAIDIARNSTSKYVGIVGGVGFGFCAGALTYAFRKKAIVVEIDKPKA
jgi:hypothetical protein